MDLVRNICTIGSEDGLFKNASSAWRKVYNDFYTKEISEYESKIDSIESKIAEIDSISSKKVEYLESLSREGYWDDYTGEYYEGNSREISEKISKEQEDRDQKAEILYNKKTLIEKEYSNQFSERIEYLKDNYESNDAIKALYEKHFVPQSISDIVTLNSDKKFKNCECKAIVEYAEEKPVKIIYSAQKDENGYIYVELIQKENKNKKL